MASLGVRMVLLFVVTVVGDRSFRGWSEAVENFCQFLWSIGFEEVVDVSDDEVFSGGSWIGDDHIFAGGREGAGRVGKVGCVVECMLSDVGVHMSGEDGR